MNKSQRRPSGRLGTLWARLPQLTVPCLNRCSGDGGRAGNKADGDVHRRRPARHAGQERRALHLRQVICSCDALVFVFSSRGRQVSRLCLLAFANGRVMTYPVQGNARCTAGREEVATSQCWCYHPYAMIACTIRNDNNAVSDSRIVQVLTDAYFSYLVLPPQAIADILKQNRTLRGGDHFCGTCARMPRVEWRRQM